MSLSLADIKRADVQSFREVASALAGMATANTDLKSGVGRLPIAGDAWKGVSGDAAHQELDRFGKLLEGSAEAKKGAAARIRRAADEFEGVKQLLAKVEQDAAKGRFKIDPTSGKVTAPSGDYNKNELNYIETTLRQIMQAGDVANADLTAAVKAAKELPDPSGSAGAALPVTPNSSTKPDGSFGALQNLATAKPDGRPAETQAAAAGADTQANYKEWYPKAPATGDKITIDPTKAGSFAGTVGALEKLPGAPKPPDGFGTGVARKFGDGVNSRVDGIVDEAKNLTGQGGPGAPGEAESWAKFVLGTADQMANPLGSLPGDVKDLVNDPAGFAGKKLFDVSALAATGPLGGEASAGMRGLLGDLTGAETRAIPHSIDNIDSAPGHHPVPQVEHPTASGDHHGGGPGVDHSPGEVGPDHHAGWESPSGGASLSPEHNSAANQFLEQARQAEPHITQSLRDIVGNNPGSELTGLEHRLKAEDSFKQKLYGSLLEDPRMSMDGHLAGMKDSVRYTMQSPEELYTANTQRAIDNLIADGYEPVKFKNSWDDPGYQGINSFWRDPSTGQTFEVQFHTPSSFDAKMQTHPLYEQERLPGISPQTVTDLRLEQNQIFDSVPRPSGSRAIDLPPSGAHR